MKLTVGSLPSAVYWRRRAIVLGGVLSAVLLLWAACSNSASSTSEKPKAAADRGSSSASATLARPIVDKSSSPPVTNPAAPPADTPAAATGPDDEVCGDSELALTAESATTAGSAGQAIQLRLKVKNVSSRHCSRDLGADMQELYLQRDSVKIWSSDACNALRGTSIRKLAPGSEQEFTVSWNGRATADGCDAQRAPSPGDYQLIARLGQKLSPAVTITLR